MKITNSDLKMAYRSHIQRCTPSSREGCPSEEAILRVFEKSFSPREKEKVIDHVVKCAHCHQEFEILLGLVRDENKAAKEISDLVRQRNRSETPSEKRAKIWGIISGQSAQRLLIWRLATISIALLVFSSIFLISIRSILRPPSAEERGRLRDQVRLISPIQGQSETPPLIFRWQKVGGAECYQLEIFSESLLPIWASPQIADFSYELPPEVAQTIEGNKVYYWMVTVFLPNGVKRESPLESFILTK